MRQVNYTDPLLLVMRTRQEELWKEAEHDRLAAQAKRSQSDINPVVPVKRRIRRPEVTIWRRTAWSLGRAAFSLGTWLLAR